MPVTLLHGVVEGGNFCSHCGKHRSAWASDDEPCDGEEPHADLHAQVPTTEKAVAAFEESMVRLTVPEADSIRLSASVMERQGDVATTAILRSLADRAFVL
jgi:hypothetical protein